MTQQTQTQQTETQDEPIEYFLEHCEFKFCWLEAQENFAEKIVQEINNKEEKN